MVGRKRMRHVGCIGILALITLGYRPAVAAEAAQVKALQLGGRHYIVITEQATAPASAKLHNQLRTRININLDQEDVVAAVLQLGQQHGFAVVAQPQLAVQPLTMQLNNVELSTALDWLARLSGLAITPTGDAVLVGNLAPPRANHAHSNRRRCPHATTFSRPDAWH